MRAKIHHIQQAITLAFLAFGAATAEAQIVGAEENFNRIYRSSYYLGRGDTGIAIADNEEAIFYNPAGLAYGKGIFKGVALLSPHIEFSKNTRDIARKIGAENADMVDTVQESVGKPNHLGVSNFTGVLLRRAAIGAITTSNVDLIAYKSHENGGLEVVEASADQTAGMTFTLAESFWKDRFLLGVTTKYLYRGRGALAVSSTEASQIQDSLDDQKNFLGYGDGFGADLGLMYRGGDARAPLSFGLTVSDIGDTSITPKEETELDLDVKQTINVGAAIEPGTKLSKVRLLVDYRDVAGRVVKNNLKKLHLGAELTVKEIFGVTGGINDGYPSVGLYTDLYVVRFDFGAYTAEMGERVGTRPDTRYFMRLRAGF